MTTENGRLTGYDRLQVNAFQAFFRSGDGTPEERFGRAIALTSDDRFAAVCRKRPGLVSDYLSRTARKAEAPPV